MSDPTTLVIEALPQADPVAFNQLVGIYEEAIPAEQRKDAATVKAMSTKANYQFLIARQDDRVIGFAITYRFTSAEICLLEYMAVEKALRSRGIGAAIFRGVVGSSFVGGRTLLLEVSTDKGAAAQKANRARRKAFYRALGCKEVDGLIYRMPKVGRTTPEPLDIMLLPSSPCTHLAKTTLERWFEAIYSEIYNRQVRDPAIEAMLSPLPERLELV